MAEKMNPNSWIHRLRRRPEQQGTDWGDLGTAFGMEMTLTSPSTGPEPTGKTSAAPGRAALRWWSRRR